MVLKNKRGEMSQEWSLSRVISLILLVILLVILIVGWVTGGLTPLFDRIGAYIDGMLVKLGVYNS